MSGLSVPSFGGGVVLEGSADLQRVDELQACDGYDLGSRGQLVVASDASDYVSINDRADAPLTPLHWLGSMAGALYADALAIGVGDWLGSARYILASFAIDGALSPIGGAGGANLAQVPAADNTLTLAPFTPGVVVTAARFPGTFTIWQGGAAKKVNLVLVNLGAREGFAPLLGGSGLYAFFILQSGVSLGIFPIGQFDALGTGAMGQQAIATAGVTPGTQARPLLFRGIAAYNGFAMGWGFDHTDLFHGDGPARLMFSNLTTATVAGPLTWGNDNQAATGDRQFTDSDAIIVGDTGERIRAGLAWNKRFWIGTNRGIHFLAGYGRDSFITDGANPVAKAENVIGPRAMIEGPDGLLYGVGDQGLWRFDGNSFDRVHKKLRRFDSHSPGWWDLIWTDRTRADNYPGKTNQDLVWMVVDWDLEQVIIGIPWCSAANGYGFGTDTVLIKFHARTQGFTRQVFTNVQYTAADFVRREGQFNAAKFLGTPTVGKATIRRYAYQATPNVSPILPGALPLVRFGEYAQFGPNGVGVYRKVYVTLSWESGASLPLAFTLTPSIDQQALAAQLLTIAAVAPVAPADGDLWLDTSGTDPNLGNGAGGTLIVASNDYVLKRWRAALAVWELVPGAGQKGTRATVPIAITPTRGSRLTLQVASTSAAGRWQLEGISDVPNLVADAA